MTLQVAYPYDRRSLEPRPLRAREIVRFLACPRRGAGGDRAAGRPDREVRGAGAVRARSCDAFERTHFSLQASVPVVALGSRSLADCLATRRQPRRHAIRISITIHFGEPQKP